MKINQQQSIYPQNKAIEISPYLSYKNNIQEPSFTGLGKSINSAFTKIADKVAGSPSVIIDNFSDVRRTLSCNYGSFFEDLLKSTKNTGIVQEVGAKTASVCEGAKLTGSRTLSSAPSAAVENENLLKRVAKSIVYPFIGLPQDIYDVTVTKLIKTFPASSFVTKLDNAEFIKNRRAQKEFESESGILRGAVKTASEAIKQYKAKGNLACDNCISITEVLDEKISDAFTNSAGNYKTFHERGIVRAVSGTIAAFFVAMDAYNMAIKNGSKKEEAQKSSNARLKQELVGMGLESYGQLAMLGGFSSFVNKNIWGAPAINSATSIISDVASRVSTGKNLLPVKVQPKPQVGAYNINSFLTSTKKGDVPSVGFSGSALNAVQVQDENKNKKGHLISVKNVLKACFISIAAGFSLKYLTKQANKLIKNNPQNSLVKASKELFEKASKSYKNFTTKDLIVSRNELQEIFEIAKGGKYDNMINRWQDGINTLPKDRVLDPSAINLGITNKTFKIPLLNIRVARADVLKAFILPFKLVKELASYPYKAVQRILLALSTNKKLQRNAKLVDCLKSWGGEKPPKPELPKERKFLSNMEKIYTDYEYRKEKYQKKDPAKFREYYKSYFEKQVGGALDEENVSKIDNTKIAKMTQLMTMFTSTYFATLDDYNQTAILTGDKEKAAQSGRERFVQKIVRVITQIGIVDIFNGVFKTQYASSLLGAAGVTAFNTLLTDCLTRPLSGKHLGRLTKDEQEKREQEREKGVFGAYYKGVKKIAQ